MYTYSEYLRDLNALVDIAKQSNLSFEQYLINLLTVVESYKDKEVTGDLIYQLLSNAFNLSPKPFDDNWLNCKPPPGIDDVISDDFATLKEMICFQIADPHLMQQRNMLNNKLVWFGVTAPSGKTWYNFSIRGFIHANLRYLNDTDNGNNEIKPSWMNLFWFLKIGQEYE